MGTRDKLKRNRLKRYEELASRKGQPEPLAYLMGRLRGAVASGDHRKAEQLATFLAPYGHGKALPRDDEGEQVTDKLTIIIGD